MALLAALFAENFLGKEFHFAPRAGPFIALGFLGFITAVVGHLTASKTIVLTGIFLVFAAVLFAPLVLYLSGRG